MDSELEKQTLAGLCSEIRAILDAELAAGGQITRVSREFIQGNNVLVVDLRHNHFLGDTSKYPDGVSYHGKDMQCGIGDHFYCTKHHHCVMASFR